MQPQPHPKFDVFLSHKSSDKEAIRDLKRRLEGEGLTCWLDEEQLLPGKRWVPLLGEALEKSEAMLACVGSDGQGPWQDLEIEAVLIQAIEQKKPVIPVLLPGRQKEAALPYFLKPFGYVDFRLGFVEPHLNRLVRAIRQSSATGTPPQPAQPSHKTALPAGNDTAQPSHPSPVDVRPMSPEEEARRTEILRRKLKEVFPTTLKALKGAVAEGSPLREVMIRAFKPQLQSEEGQALELLCRMYDEFSPALGQLIHIYKREHNPDVQKRILNLVGSVLFLSMAPEYAEGLPQGMTAADGRTVEIPSAAGEGLKQILACWMQGHDAVSLEPRAGTMLDVPPPQEVEEVRRLLIKRFGLPGDAPNIDKLLEVQIECRLERMEAEWITVSGLEVLAEIRKKDSPLSRLLVFIHKAGESIRPGHEHPNLLPKLEDHVRVLRDAATNAASRNR